MGHVIGIDLGTTNTAVSVVIDGRPKMLEDSHGYKVVPSVVPVLPETRRSDAPAARRGAPRAWPADPEAAWLLE